MSGQCYGDLAGYVPKHDEHGLAMLAIAPRSSLLDRLLFSSGFGRAGCALLPNLTWSQGDGPRAAAPAELAPGVRPREGRPNSVRRASITSQAQTTRSGLMAPSDPTPHVRLLSDPECTLPSAAVLRRPRWRSRVVQRVGDTV